MWAGAADADPASEAAALLTALFAVESFAAVGAFADGVVAARLLRGVNDPAFVEVWEWRLEPGERHASGDHAPGTRELVYVHAGSFTVVVDREPHEVKTGETIDFRADRPHEYRNDGAEAALLTMVVVMPAGQRDRSRP